jgi:hypothetical protein
MVGPAGPSFGAFTTTDVGVIGLWVAALLTLITGYDYLRAGLRHVDELDNENLAALDKIPSKAKKNRLTS